MRKEKEKILEIIKMTLHSVAPDAKIILFGSQARGDEKPDSDWDILIIMDGENIVRSEYDKITNPLYDLGWETGKHFSAIVYSKTEWEKRKFTPFYKNIEKKGILL
jgi:uncharacterized protein